MRGNRKNPADMAFDTLVNAFYDQGSHASPNWVLPIDCTEYTKRIADREQMRENARRLGLLG